MSYIPTASATTTIAVKTTATTAKTEITLKMTLAKIATTTIIMINLRPAALHILRPNIKRAIRRTAVNWSQLANRSRNAPRVEILIIHPLLRLPTSESGIIVPWHVNDKIGRTDIGTFIKSSSLRKRESVTADHHQTCMASHL